MSLLPPMGEDAEQRLRVEMANWDEPQLIAKTVKAPGLAADIAARQILAYRQKSKETRRFQITVAIGIISISLSALAAWFAWKAIPQKLEPTSPTPEPAASAPSGTHTSASPSKPQIQSIPSSAIEPSKTPTHNR